MVTTDAALVGYVSVYVYDKVYDPVMLLEVLRYSVGTVSAHLPVDDISSYIRTR